MGSTLLFVALIAATSFLFNLNRHLNGTLKRQIETSLALVLLGLVAASFAVLDWTSGLLCFIAVVVFPRLSQPAALSLARRWLESQGGHRPGNRRAAPLSADVNAERQSPHEARDILGIALEVSRGLTATRKQFLVDAGRILEDQGRELSQTPSEGSELDAALRGYQLTAVVGFAWKHLPAPLWAPFDRELTRRLEEEQAGWVGRHRERYLDCQGNPALLTQSLATDVYRLCGSPEPSERILAALADAAMTLAMLSQAKVAATIGDSRTEKRLVQMARRW